MWNFFSKDPSKDLVNFEIQEAVSLDYELQEKTIWSLNNAKKKGSLVSGGSSGASGPGGSVTVASGPNDSLFSVFSCQAKQGNEPWLNAAKSGFKRIKMLRHPNILMFQDGVDSDKAVYIVTERVQTLYNYLKESKESDSQKENEISWGLYQIATALSFINADCKLVHNNLCMASVVVNRAGEWKLTGLEYTHGIDDSYIPGKVLPSLERYEPPERSPAARSSSNRIDSSGVDSWMLGCLIWEIYNGILPSMNALKNPGNIPKKLVPVYTELINANIGKRLTPAKFISVCRQPNGFMSNHFVDTLLFLEQIQIKDQAEKNKLFTELTQKLDDFPRNLCLFKILPQLLAAYEFGNAGSTVLPPLFKLGKLLEDADYQKKIIPVVVKLFSSTDRATRMRLLSQLHLFVEHLSASIINDQIFPHICLGFNDTNPAIRENTIRAIVLIVPKLNYNNLNVELMKHFARLQAQDDQGMIRTNTTVCIGKIANYINPQLRQRILLSAFPKAMRDPFPLARLSGIVALANTDRYYTLRDIATKVLPSLCMLTIDPEKDVRDEAFKTMKQYMQKMEKVSEQPELALEMEKEVQSCALDLKNETSWTSWAVNSLSTKMANYNKKTVQPSVALNTQPLGPPPGVSKTGETNPAPKVESSESFSQVGGGKSSMQPQTQSSTKLAVKEVESNQANNGGWNFDDNITDDDWKDLDGDDDRMEPLEPSFDTKTNLSTKPSATTKSTANDWSSDWINSFEEIDNKGGSKKISNNNTSFFNDPVKNEEDMFSNLVKDMSQSIKDTGNKSTTASKQSSAKQQTTASASSSSTNWSNDWNDVFEDSANKNAKKQQRNVDKQKENEAKQKAGPLKLGQKKNTPDFF